MYVSHISCLDSLHQSQPGGDLNLSSLVPILMDLWVECVADALVSVNKITTNKSLTICNVVLQLLNMLWRGLGSVNDSRRVIMDGSRGHILGHFPFGKGCSVARDAEKILGEMNICFAELLSQFSGSKGRMSEFLVDLFTWKSGFRVSALKMEQLTRSYPVIWSVVTGDGEEETKHVLVEKVLRYFDVVGNDESVSGVKSELFEFIANMFRVFNLG
jgi:hypothetical protein